MTLGRKSGLERILYRQGSGLPPMADETRGSVSPHSPRMLRNWRRSLAVQFRHGGYARPSECAVMLCGNAFLGVMTSGEMTDAWTRSIMFERFRVCLAAR